MGNNSKSFENASNYDELKRALKYRFDILHNTDNGEVNYLCHYTRLSSAIAIIRSRQWYIGSPKKMNDGLEISRGSESEWEKFYFASFMFEPKESIAMWSMYAQPWEDGVMIRIPVKVFKKWVRDKDIIIREAISKERKDKKSSYHISAGLISYFVAYTNAYSRMEGGDEKLYCGTSSEKQCNTKVKDVLSTSELRGYVKDMAWSYENEIRLRVDIDSDHHIEGLLIDIPDYIIDSLEIVAGPKFDGVLSERIEQEIQESFDNNRLNHSIFKDKLNWTYCDDCEKVCPLDSELRSKTCIKKK